MNSTRRILDTPNVARSHAASRGEGANAADFHAAFTDALSTSGSANAPAVGADRNRYAVKAGETLYGIAKARLAAAGQPATHGASMRHALQIAQANQIRNPDRILAGQQIDLPPAAAPTIRESGIDTASARNAAPVDGDSTRALHALEQQHRLPETAPADNSVEHACAAAGCLAPPPMVPVAERLSADDDLGSRVASTGESRVGIALYEQTLAAPAPRLPSELPDIVYKGVVGKALDLVPLEPATRAGLQQVNAVVGGSLVGRSLAALTGLGGPILTVAGLLWGIFSAQKINAMQSDAPKQLAQNTTAQFGD